MLTAVVDAMQMMQRRSRRTTKNLIDPLTAAADGNGHY